MAYDVAVLVMMATAIAGILYAQRETVKKGVRFSRRTRLPERPAKPEGRPSAEAAALEYYTRALSLADAMCQWTATSAVVGAEWAHAQKRLLKIRPYVRHSGRPQIADQLEQFLEVLVTAKGEQGPLRERGYDAGKTEFLMKTADSLNDLLTAMYGSASFARHRLAPEDPLQESMRTIEQSARRAGALASRLVRLARTGTRLTTGATGLREALVRQEKILAHHGQTFDSMERRLRRLEEEAALKQERATEDEPKSRPVKPFIH
jgi:signal transduction histidine kinase